MRIKYGRSYFVPALMLIALAVIEALVVVIVLPRSVAAHEAAPSRILLSRWTDTSLHVRAEIDLVALRERMAFPTVVAGSDPAQDMKDIAAHISQSLGLTASGQAIPTQVAGAKFSKTGSATVELIADFKSGLGDIAVTPGPVLGDSLIIFVDRQEMQDRRFVTSNGTVTFAWEASRNTARLSVVVLDYVTAGFTHIVPKGLDHMLFVAGLFLLTLRLRPLLLQVSLFTVAHTFTLALGATGYVVVPTAVIEPLIAASIVFIAVENVVTKDLSRWRPFAVFGFGLLHGLGFASVIGEFGLPQTHFLAALIAFNVGVELGQFFVLAVCFASMGYWFSQKGWYRQRITLPASVALGAVGMFWTVERIGGAL